MEFTISEASKIFKEFSGGSGFAGMKAALTYVAGIKFYAKLLNKTGKQTLVEFIYDTRLSGEARRCFFTRPASLEIIYETLTKRFSINETIAEITGSQIPRKEI